jgi:hypothetical protein
MAENDIVLDELRDSHVQPVADALCGGINSESGSGSIEPADTWTVDMHGGIDPDPEAPTGRTRTATSLRLSDALPFLSSLSIFTLGRICRESHLEVPSATLPNTSLAELDQIDLGAFANAVARATIDDSAFEVALINASPPRHPLGELLPTMRYLSGVIPRDRLPIRTYNGLRRNGIERWEQLACVSLGNIFKFRNLGVLSVGEVFALAIEESIAVARQAVYGLPANKPETPNGFTAASTLEPLIRQQLEGDTPGAISDGRLDPYEAPVLGDRASDGRVLSDLKTITAWASTECGITSFKSAVLLAIQSADTPVEVRKACERLEAIDLAAFSAADRHLFDSDAAIKRVLSSLRSAGGSFDILLRRELALCDRWTLGDLGEVHGVTRERIRQIESAQVKAIRQALGRPENLVIKRAADRLAGELGTALPLETLLSREPDATSNEMLDFANPALTQLRLLLWLGPYRVENRWVIRQTTPSLVQLTAAKLDELTADGPIAFTDALAAVGELGIKPDYREWWLDEIPGFRRFSDRVARWRGTLLDKAEVILQLNGEPMTADDIAASMRGEASSARGLASRMTEDPRFSRSGLKHLALSEWGYDEYSSVVDEMTEEIQARGGEASVDELAELIAGKFGVSPHSVRMYASGANFVKVGAGRIRVRTDSDPLPTAPPVEQCRRCYRLGRGWALRLPVTVDTLRGSGTVVPVGFVAHAGVNCLSSRAIPTPYGDLLVSWNSMQGSIGSVRAVVEDLGAEEGDLLFVEFTDEQRFDFTLLRQTELDGLDAGQRLVREVGSSAAAAGSDDVLAAVAHAIGMGIDPPPSSASVRHRLVSRGEEDLARLLDSVGDQRPTDDAELFRMLQVALDRLT